MDFVFAAIDHVKEIYTEGLINRTEAQHQILCAVEKYRKQHNKAVRLAKELNGEIIKKDGKYFVVQEIEIS